MGIAFRNFRSTLLDSLGRIVATSLGCIEIHATFILFVPVF